MKKVEQFMLETNDDREAVRYITVATAQFPTEEGYRIETFMSPRFLRITIYKVK